VRKAGLGILHRPRARRAIAEGEFGGRGAQPRPGGLAAGGSQGGGGVRNGVSRGVAFGRWHRGAIA
jgi:hypothetical protein